MGCGSSSTKVTEFRPTQDKHSPVRRESDDRQLSNGIHNGQTPSARKDSLSSKSSWRKTKSISSSASSLKERNGSAKSDKIKPNVDNSGKFSAQNSGRQSKSVKSSASSIRDRVGSAKSDQIKTEDNTAEKHIAPNSGRISRSTNSSASSLKDRIGSSKSDHFNSQHENDTEKGIDLDNTPVIPNDTAESKQVEDSADFMNKDSLVEPVVQENVLDDTGNVLFTDITEDTLQDAESDFNDGTKNEDNDLHSIENEMNYGNDEENKSEHVHINDHHLNTVIKTEVSDHNSNEITNNEEGVLQGDDNEKEAYEEFPGLELIQIDIPERDPNKQINDYTIDEIVNNNAEKGRNDWFLYGRKVYELQGFVNIVRNRINNFLKLQEMDYTTVYEIMKTMYPVYGARYYGVRRKELEAILPICQIGNISSMPRAEYISRLKHCVDNIKTDLEAEETLIESLADYLEQLSRWLSNYPNVELEAPLDRNNVDPNECAYPLPDKIIADPSVLRKWSVDWVLFDFTVDANGAWTSIPLVMESLGDTHQLFADLVCSTHVDATLPDLVHEIEGEAAWDVIKVDIVKNDETTEAQDALIIEREKRTDLKDLERMKRRRKELADGFLKRHEERLKPEAMIDYIDWASRLEQHWKEFQELCENDFSRPQQTHEPQKLEDVEETQPKLLPESIPPHDTQSLLSELGTN